MSRQNFFSLEFFPPRDVEAAERLQKTTQELLVINPDFISVTFGAGGSTQEGTLETVRMLKAQGIKAVPHLSCIGNKADRILGILEQFKQMGVDRIVALRGDLPSGMGLVDNGLRYASDLVSLIRQHHGDHFHIEVAAYPEMHPQADSPSADLDHFITKVKAGADSAITQYFYNADAYFDFVNRLQAKGINIPVIAGIMPITNYSQLSRFSQMCGAEIPRWIRLRLAEFGDDRASIRSFGIEVVSQLCQQLIDNGAPGIHFYTLNQSAATLAIWNNLNNA
ncbi:methylenetetrahydrofolate reductase [NAD(P)H] [Pelistega europaea]|uniref:Methylenetetrahydrofolate reductase n=1 Tax=Pelistega europaea TaxID=106147 RepID=A0A7Y4LBC6_9BURK|nr:methylenetetrahydrofolate reductase [NAD(P)H] [Pelistega europaea]NOL50387.1 methylenetetrahydrofolate reductase [NAD(P)H] [Pelistega europaea]